MAAWEGKTVGALRTAVVAAGLLALGSCGQSMDTQLPDLATKSTLPDGRKTLSQAEQQKAIDALIAKRDKQDAAK